MYSNYRDKGHLQPESWSEGDSLLSGWFFCRLLQDRDLPCRSASSKHNKFELSFVLNIQRPRNMEGNCVMYISLTRSTEHYVISKH